MTKKYGSYFYEDEEEADSPGDGVLEPPLLRGSVSWQGAARPPTFQREMNAADLLRGGIVLRRAQKLAPPSRPVGDDSPATSSPSHQPELNIVVERWKGGDEDAADERRLAPFLRREPPPPSTLTTTRFSSSSGCGGTRAYLAGRNTEVRTASRTGGRETPDVNDDRRPCDRCGRRQSKWRRPSIEHPRRRRRLGGAVLPSPPPTTSTSTHLNDGRVGPYGH